MDIKTALNTILDDKELKKAWSVLANSEEESSREIKKLLENLVNETRSGKKFESDYIINLLELTIRFQVKEFSLFESLLNDSIFFTDDEGHPILPPEFFSSVVANAASDIDEINGLRLLFFSNDIAPWNKVVIFHAVCLFYSSSIGLENAGNSVFTESINERKEKKISFFLEIIKDISDNWNEDTVMESHGVLCFIANDCFSSDFYGNKELRNALSSVILQIITTSGLGSNCSIFKQYFKLLLQTNPKEYCRVTDAVGYIRKLRANLEDENIFSASSLEEAGHVLFNKTVKNICGATNSTVKAAIQILHEYPLNQRPVPVTDEQYYEEIMYSLGITGLPQEKYLIAKDKFSDIRKEYELLTERINNLEKACEDLINKSNKETEKINAGQRCIKCDIREDQNRLLEELQKRKELESLYRKRESSDSKDAKEADCYLEYCKDSLKKTFKLFIQGAVSEEEIERALRKWVLNDVRDGNSYSIDRIEERFAPYSRLLNQFNALMQNDPFKTIQLLKYRIKSLPFMNIIKEKHWHISGKKLLDNSSPEYAKYKEELDNHALNVEALLNNTDAIKYLNRLESAMPKVHEMMHKHLEASLCFRRRKGILKKIITQFQEGNYDVVVNMIPVQIEGLFADFLENSLLYETKQRPGLYEQIYNSVWTKKATIVDDKDLNLGFDAIGYFKYYFNSVYRNTVAHGNYRLLLNSVENTVNLPEEQTTKIVAHEMMFDLNYIMDIISKSNEFDAAKEYLESTAKSLSSDAEYRYERLMLDLFKEERFNPRNYKHGIFISYEPTRILYWIFNPLFEDEIGTETVKPVRDAIFSADFWTYVADHIENRLKKENKQCFQKTMSILMPILTENSDAFQLAKRVNQIIK